MKKGMILSARNKRRENKKWLFEQTRNPNITRFFCFERDGLTFIQTRSKLITTNELDYGYIKTMFDESTIKEKFVLVKKEDNYLLWEKVEEMFSKHYENNQK